MRITELADNGKRFGRRRRAGRSLGLRWGILSTLGLAVGMSAGLLLLGPAEVVVGMVLVVPVVFAISGAILGASQWFAVRYLTRATSWITLSAAGLASGLTLGTIAIELVGSWIAGAPVRLSTASEPALFVAFLGLGGISGLTLGAAQWICLRGRFGGCRRSGGGRMWVAANSLALAIGMPVGLLVADLFGTGVRSPLGMVTLFVVAAGACGLVTGQVLEAHAREAGRTFRLSRA